MTRPACTGWLLGLVVLLHGTSCLQGRTYTHDPGAKPSIPDPSTCTEIHVMDPARYTGAGSFFGDHVGAEIDADLGGGGYHAFAIKLRDDHADLVPGTFTLGEGMDGDYLTCSHCVMVLENVWGDNVNSFNFALTGTMVLEAANVETGESRGTVSNVILKPLNNTAQHHHWSGWADSSHCLLLKHASWNTYAGLGNPCADTEDCTNHQTQVCDPRTARCSAPSCTTEHQDCTGTDVCMVQYPAYGTGACAPTCAPFTSGTCPGNQECVSIAYDGSRGICKHAGSTSLGSDCATSTTSTGCSPGSVCQAFIPFWSKQTCVRTCNFFAPQPGCPTGSTCRLTFYRDKDLEQYCGSGGRCHQGGTCFPIDDDDLDRAAVGEQCGEYANVPCGVDELRAEGVCDADSNSRCMRICRLQQQDCPPGETCRQYHHRDDGDTQVPGMGVCVRS